MKYSSITYLDPSTFPEGDWRHCDLGARDGSCHTFHDMELLGCQSIRDTGGFMNVVPIQKFMSNIAVLRKRIRV